MGHKMKAKHKLIIAIIPLDQITVYKRLRTMKQKRVYKNFSKSNLFIQLSILDHPYKFKFA